MEDLRIEVYFIYLLVASFSNIWILDGRIHSSLSTETWDSVYSVILSLENREKSTISFHISSFTNVGKTCPVSLLSIMVGPPLLSGWLEDKDGNTQDDPREAQRVFRWECGRDLEGPGDIAGSMWTCQWRSSLVISRCEATFPRVGWRHGRLLWHPRGGAQLASWRYSVFKWETNYLPSRGLLTLLYCHQWLIKTKLSSI